MGKALEFKISSGLKDIIGKDLITDDFVAVFELVKNSYDARAKKVIITFEQNTIRIADNGKGMSFDDIQNKWLFVAYSAKKDGTEDSDIPKEDSYRSKINSKRYYAGAKGIGRFSSDRLGKKLVLTSKTTDSLICEQINVDWNKFEKDQQEEFININVDYGQVVYTPNLFPDNSSHGTILEIKPLNSSWDREKLKGLKHSLEKLINPFSGTDDFSIEIICKKELDEDKAVDKFGNPKYIERDKINGVIKNSILDILNLKTTQIEVHITHKEILTTVIDRGDDIYKIREENKNHPLLDDVKISLYYLNRTAKANFTRRMGLEPVNYGSIFLFKNGFRVQPFGNKGDDSWGLDYRAQQGHSRFLGTRDLFGKVEIYTDNSLEFKEVSSRDGGLVETKGSHQLLKAFETTHRRLERYVSGVLWGEGFIRRNYFDSEATAKQNREYLLENDKEAEDTSAIRKSLGSKIDFVQIIKSLVKDKDVEVLYYNKDLADIISNRLDELKPKFLQDLEEIAEKTNDDKLKSKVLEAERQIHELQKAKEEAERKLEEQIKKREEAERKAKEAEAARIAEEERRKKEEALKKEAELKAKEAELKQKEAELKKKEAEQKAREEVEKRAKAEEDRKKAEQERDVEKSKNKYLSATRNLTPEVEDIIHTIKISSNELESSSKSMKNIVKGNPVGNDILRELDYIQFHIERINKLSSLLTKADINSLKEHSKVDIPAYIKEYLPNYAVSIKDIQFNNQFSDTFIRKISLLDLSVILDNLISNSKKAGATKIFVDFKKENGKLHVDFSDDGTGVDDSLLKNNSLFEVGITNRRGGSGIGLNTIRETLRKDLHGDIEFLGNNKHFKKGATFRLIF
jgi:signal transduction histidine kinase